MSTQQFKIVFKGALKFDSKRSFDLAYAKWAGRLDTHFKTDVLFKSDAIFQAEALELRIGTATFQAAGIKSWRNTSALLKDMAEFAVTGQIKGWVLNLGATVEALHLEPESERKAVYDYRQGCRFLDQGDMAMAEEALTNAISNFAHHALAFERRGYMNYKLKNFDAALHDFERSSAINPDMPAPFYGSGKVKMLKNQWEAACEDFKMAQQKSLALESIHWLARLRKSDCMIHMQRYAEALSDLEAYLSRAFPQGDICISRIPKACFLHGKALIGLGRIDEGLDSFLMAKNIAAKYKTLTEQEQQVLERLVEPGVVSQLDAVLRQGASLDLALNTLAASV